jgi:hypothetical protein
MAGASVIFYLFFFFVLSLRIISQTNYRTIWGSSKNVVIKLLGDVLKMYNNTSALVAPANSMACRQDLFLFIVSVYISKNT